MKLIHKINSFLIFCAEVTTRITKNKKVENYCFWERGLEGSVGVVAFIILYYDFLLSVYYFE